MRTVKPMRAWADIGSHGGIFAFDSGPVGDRYPGLLQIYTTQVTPDLVEVMITPVTGSPLSAHQRATLAGIGPAPHKLRKLVCWECGTDLVEGEDQYADSWICPKCIK